ncbi:right-handed parallel beta-helix repeat-containing protein [Paenibacillus glycanilyticus]|uniref:right-handed parallel beta-helix repeat-containing protein n=1 Tax=Paenibacillus glycanilyticus TaxID=126569 RepID=UPI001FD1E8EB|nr:right-handed parallel beta-helix repeat-containing protein [Paenibacillus glycanilyticus]
MVLIISENPVVIRLTDYGAVPDSGADAQPAMRRAIEAASRVQGPVLLDIPRGRYDFHPDEAVRAPYYISNTASESENTDVTKTIGILLKGLKDLTLEGNGALLVFHGKMTMLAIDGCEGIRIRNLHADYEWPTVTEMTIAAVGSDYFDAEVHPDSRYAIEEGRLVWIGEGWRFTEGPMQEYDPIRDTTWRIDNVVERASKVEELAPNRLRVFVEDGSEVSGLTAGRVLQMRDGIRDQVGAFIHRSRDVSWSGVGMHFMHGLGIVGQFSENLSFKQMDFSPRAETGRTVTAFADFIHLSGCRGKVEIADSRFVGGHDDPINAHGTHLRIVGTPAPDQLVLRFMHHQTYGFDALIPGDEIEFVRHASLLAYGSGTVKTTERLSPREVLLTLEAPVPSDIRPDDVIENVTWTPEVRIAGNYFARIPTRGVLITTRRKVVIEDNLFERMTMSGISVADDAESWYESGKVGDLTIRNNRFIECGGPDHPVIVIAPENTELDAARPVHAGIRIEGNRIETRDAAALGAKSAGLIDFISNEIVMTADADKPVRSLITLTACRGVRIAGNILSGEGLERDVRLRQMPADEVVVEAGQGLRTIAE